MLMHVLEMGVNNWGQWKLMKNIRHVTNLRYNHYLIVGDFNLREIDWENCSRNIYAGIKVNAC